MPTYDYVCGACAHAFEQFQTMSAKKLRRCPKCKKPALERLVGTGAGLIFKGTGFYITDYRKPDAAGDSSPPPSATAPSKATPSPGESQGAKEAPSKPASDAKGAAGGSPAPAAPSAKPSASGPPAKPAESARSDRPRTSKRR